MASIKKRINKKGQVSWQAAVFVGRDAKGKQLFEYVTRDSERECKKAARELEQQRDEGKLSKIPNMRFSAWAKEWLKINEGRLSPSTYATYCIFNKAHFEPDLGHLKLNQINETHLKKFMSEKLKKKMARSSVRRMMSVLKVMLHDALKQKSPANELKLPSDEKKEAKIPTDQEFEKMRADVKGTTKEAILLLSGWCGCRRGEILAIKPNDLNKDKCTVTIDEARAITSESKYVDKDTKNYGVRTIVVPQELMDMLWEIRKKNTDKKRLFDMRPDALTRWFTRAKERFNWPDITFHGLRHYHASWLYAQGIPDKYAAKRLGHDVRILKSIYQHIGVDHEKQIDDNIINMNKKPDKRTSKKCKKKTAQ